MTYPKHLDEGFDGYREQMKPKELLSSTNRFTVDVSSKVYYRKLIEKDGLVENTKCIVLYRARKGKTFIQGHTENGMPNSVSAIPILIPAHLATAKSLIRSVSSEPTQWHLQ